MRRDNHPDKRGRRVHPDRRSLSSELSRYTHSHGVMIHCQIDPKNHNIWLPFDRAMMVVAKILGHA
jgi:hypothetical protein